MESPLTLSDTIYTRGFLHSLICFKINGKSHLFLGGDKSHPQSKEIRLLLEALPEKKKATGYIPDTSFLLHGVGEEEKECNLKIHSEKLAIAFGLLNTSPDTVLRGLVLVETIGD
ncbi:pentatricopeptide repeat-containing protein At2g01510, mitochondrial-like [Camellia sinensis]|uniref:pentatricopeptide repeat-containing protein At2g01510, mitochondrial-like n=1 Tax=Camellia sinensis TaxID=4442 RepID=UPI00103673D6|nr:pentatricopeptide repeat-containing protein At2g01510, mitochondrial-like [Camellia sinensis]